MTPDVCPNCGAAVPRAAKACRECGSCEETGWSAEAAVSDLDLPEEAFDYDDFTKREFGGPTPKPRGISWFWWAVAIVVLLALLGLLVKW